MTDEASALAVYGSLSPGEKNHWVLRSIEGNWVSGIARGFEFEITWGAAEGYEGFLCDDNGNHVSVMVLLSNRLDKNWRSVDEFHGEGFVRQIVPVTLSDESVIQAWMYTALTDA